MATIEDPRERIERLIASADRQIQRAFLDMIASVRNEQDLAVIAGLIEAGRVEEAVQRAARDMAERLSSTTSSIYMLAADGTAKFFTDAVEIALDFDRTNDRAIRYLRANRMDLIREIGNDVRGAVREALVAGTTRGLNPRDQARQFRSAIGLTARQERAVQNYRRLLEQGSAEALQRELRDRRFDRRVLRAVEGVGGFDPLSADEIDRMEDRYRARYIKYRAEVIGRTEALRAVHAGTEEMMQQAIDSGKIQPGQLERQWNTSIDGRERDSHRAMDQQTRGMGEPFRSGDGFSLMFPGDPNAPPEETVQCRCVLTTRVVTSPIPQEA